MHFSNVDFSLIWCSFLSFISNLDNLYKLAMIIFGLSNLYIAITVYNSNKDKSKKDHRVAMFRAVLLDYHIRIFYDLLMDIENCLFKLKKRDCDKIQLEKDLRQLFSQLYYRFISVVGSVDTNMADKMNELLDNCRDSIMTSLSDEGINLYVDSMYNHHILTPFWEMKRSLISEIFHYDGTIVSNQNGRIK